MFVFGAKIVFDAEMNRCSFISYPTNSGIGQEGGVFSVYREKRVYRTMFTSPSHIGRFSGADVFFRIGRNDDKVVCGMPISVGKWEMGLISRLVGDKVHLLFDGNAEPTHLGIYDFELEAPDS